MSTSVLFILIIALMAAGAPYAIRSFYWNRFLKYIQNNQYEKALQLSQSRLFLFLFGEINTKWNQLKIYLELKDQVQIERLTKELYAKKLSNKQRAQISNSIYFYYLDTENKEMAKMVLNQLQLCCDSKDLIYNEVLYRVLIEKKSDDINIVENLLKESKKNSKEEGLLYYLLGLQYIYKKDSNKAFPYLNRAKNDLKGTPYHNKIKKIIQSKEV